MCNPEYAPYEKRCFVSDSPYFRELAIFGTGRPERKKLFSQDKGQAAMVKEFLEGLKRGGAQPIRAEELIEVMRATLFALESLRSARVLRLS